MFSLLCASVNTHIHTPLTLVRPIERERWLTWLGVAEGALTFSGLAPTSLCISFVYPCLFQVVSLSSARTLTSVVNVTFISMHNSI